MAWIGYILTSWLIADFVAGFFHWWEDEYAEPTWPIIGTLVAGPNALHHKNQTAFLRGNYWQRNWTTILPAVIAAMPFVYFIPSSWLVFCFLTQANELHSWSHRKCNRFIQCVQETGLFCSPLHHSKHHRDPFSKRYCVMSNVLNPLLDYIHFWRALERIGYVAFRATPRSSLTVTQHLP